MFTLSLCTQRTVGARSGHVLLLGRRTHSISGFANSFPPIDSFTCSQANGFKYSQKLLQDEFLEIPVKFVQETLKAEKQLFRAYFVLEAAERTYYATSTPKYKKVKARQRKAQVFKEIEGFPAAEEMKRELAAARKKRQLEEGKELTSSATFL